MENGIQDAKQLGVEKFVGYVTCLDACREYEKGVNRRLWDHSHNGGFFIFGIALQPTKC